jgi:predicted ABC-type ATPase
MVTKVGASDACSSFLSPFYVRLIINNGLSMGSQIDYIQQARANGYAVIVTNTNLNTDESLSSRALIRVSMSRSIEIDRHTRLADSESCSLTEH